MFNADAYLKSLQRSVEAFLKAEDMPATRFGRDALNDPNFVFDLRNGRVPSPRLVERVEQFMAARKRAKRKTAA